MKRTFLSFASSIKSIQESQLLKNSIPYNTWSFHWKLKKNLLLKPDQKLSTSHWDTRTFLLSILKRYFPFWIFYQRILEICAQYYSKTMLCTWLHFRLERKVILKIVLLLKTTTFQNKWSEYIDSIGSSYLLRWSNWTNQCLLPRLGTNKTFEINQIVLFKDSIGNNTNCKVQPSQKVAPRVFPPIP